MGRTVLMDHRWSAAAQTARVYAAQVEEDGEDATLVLRCYMPRTETTRDTITAIESGILRECSVGLAVGRVECSICGADQTDTVCRHRAGREYEGQKCHFVLSDVQDVYEISLCAVPAQPEAGVIKSKRYGGTEQKNDPPKGAGSTEVSIYTPGAGVTQEICHKKDRRSTMNYQMLLELKHARAEKVKAGQGLLDKKDLEGHKALMAEIEGMNAEIDAAEKQLELERTYGESEGDGQARKVYAPGQEGEGQDGYTKAVKDFAAAARAGFPVRKDSGGHAVGGQQPGWRLHRPGGHCKPDHPLPGGQGEPAGRGSGGQRDYQVGQADL